MVRYLLLALAFLPAPGGGRSGERTVWDEEDEAREAALEGLPEVEDVAPRDQGGQDQTEVD